MKQYEEMLAYSIIYLKNLISTDTGKAALFLLRFFLIDTGVFVVI